MNYIIAFLYLNFNDEEITFNCFCYVMDNYNKALFQNNFVKLYSNFYKSATMIDIYLPKLAQHFQVIIPVLYFINNIYQKE